MRSLLIVVLVVGVTGLLLHFLALWAERRGWIYYRKARGSALGSAMSAVDPIYNPGKSHQVEEQQRLEDDRDDEDAGSPPIPGEPEMNVFLQTDRLLLRRFTEKDVDLLVDLDGDAEVMRFINGGRPTSREEIETEYLPDFLWYYDNFAGYGFWAAIEKASGEFLGWFHFRPEEGASPDEPELGYRLRRSAWGKGFATEGSLALIRKGFTELGVRRVVASTMTVNVASRRVMEKAGLRFVKTFHQDWPDVIEGSEKGDVEYAVTKTEWDQQNRIGS
jgi:RimJ/RimL family protein N-acetyltransferase